MLNESSQNNPEVRQSLKQQNYDLRHNSELLRIKSTLHLQKIIEIWQTQQQDLPQYFENYETMPYSELTTEMLFRLQRVKMVRTEHKLYFGEIHNKKKQGRGIAIYRTGKIYEGQFYNNEKSGHGVELYQNGNVYVGDFSQNKKHGKGSFFWFNMSPENNSKEVQQYHGDWWGGLPDGMGEHRKCNGDLYVGSFKNGLKHGQGTQMYDNGDKYKGEFINGLCEGYGEYLWVDGSMYKGDFKQGARNGYGLWKGAKGTNEMYKGHYMLDKKHGYGIYDWGNGYTYKGFWLDDLRYGEGELLYNNEVEYNGYWENGQKVDQKPDMKQMNSKMRQTTQTTLVETGVRSIIGQSKVTQRHCSSQEKKKPVRNCSAQKQRNTSKQQFSLSFNRDNSQQKSRVGHKNCVPQIPIGKMPRPAWKNAWKKGGD